MTNCDWCGGNGESLDPAYPCIQCGGTGLMRENERTSYSEPNSIDDPMYFGKSDY
jgi:DnaJ-class molecular chaperone